MLLPVPLGLSVRHQVCNQATGSTYGEDSRLTIELLFRDAPGLETNFSVDTDHPAGWHKFSGDKVHFAQNIVPAIGIEFFAPFRPMFDFIQAKLASI